jgi:hypothetical protein
VRRRNHPRRPPGLHRAPAPAPETPSEVIERAPAAHFTDPPELEPAPPLRRDQIARLEAATALWVRETRIGGPQPEDTLLYAAPKPPPPPRRDSVEAGIRRAVDASREAASVPPAPVSREVPKEHPPIPTEEKPGEPDAAGPNEAPGGVVPDTTNAPRVMRDWSSRHDPRSRDYDVAARIRVRVPIQDRVWTVGPIFDQGTTPPLSVRDASGCVGMGVAAAANTLALSAPGENRPAWPLLSKDEALGLYDRAQDLDHVSSTRKGGAPGTSVLAGMKAGQEAGLWPGYVWAFGTRDIAQAVLQIGPVVVGIPWDDRLESPAVTGIITPGGRPAGGHALAIVGIVMSRGGQVGPFFVLQQSRGADEGDRGLVYLHHRDLTRLLAGRGEAAVPIPPGGLP